MKAVILAGGLGTRLSEETDINPKPMVKIGDKPILWHIMKTYSFHGVNEFIVCCGYKGDVIKEYFSKYFLNVSDITFNIEANSIQVHDNKSEPWSVTLIDTGEKSMTGGRLKRVHPFVKDEKAFCFTYGDGLSDVDITRSIEFHHAHGRQATMTAARPAGRYGVVKFSADGEVTHFQEKPDSGENWINGGFFVLSPKVIERIEDDLTSWEGGPLTSLAVDNELMAFKHSGFWQPMDTLREKILLNHLWSSGKAPWKVW